MKGRQAKTLVFSLSSMDPWGTSYESIGGKYEKCVIHILKFAIGEPYLC